MKFDIRSHSWYHQKHHNPSGGYYNLQGATHDVSPLRAAKWMFRHFSHNREGDPAPVTETDVNWIRHRPETLRATWLGHATMLLQTPDLNILLDPVFSVRCSPIPVVGPTREPDLPLTIEQLPAIDLVLLSHDHYDHLDKPSIQELDQRFSPAFLVPLGLKKRLTKWGVTRVAELDWWQHLELADYHFHCTPARHFSGRGILDRNSTLWCGWFIEPAGELPTIYYAGDTAYADHFSNLTLHLHPPDVAILPIGSYQPRWFMGLIHMTPEQAWQAFIDLKAQTLLPVHWGTFNLSEESLMQPIEELRRVVSESEDPAQMAELAIGASYSWQPVGASGTPPSDA